MRLLTLTALCGIILLTSSHCENKSDPPNGHLKLAVTYPEAVVENDTIYWIQVPGVGAEVRLYDGEARCDGYRDAKIDVAWIGNDATYSLYTKVSNEEGEVIFKDIPAGEYYLIVYAGKLYKYSEKYIELIGGDTLSLSKDFSPELAFVKDLEPWDYEMPGY